MSNDLTTAGAIRQRRRRRRAAAGTMCVTVEVNALVIDWLVKKARWLQRHEVTDAGLVGPAISALLKDSARRCLTSSCAKGVFDETV